MACGCNSKKGSHSLSLSRNKNHHSKPPAPDPAPIFPPINWGNLVDDTWVRMVILAVLILMVLGVVWYWKR